MLSSLAPARRRLVLLVVTLLVLGAIATVAVAVLGRDDPVHANGQDTPGPVVLVPGYGGGTAGLTQLATTLRAHGKTSVVAQLPGDARGDLDAQARSLATTVDRVLRQTRTASVDVVGYSAGGVVARLWVREHGGATHARRVISLGSPQHGTDLAGLASDLLPGACPTACQQLKPNSAVLARLNSDDETPPGPTWVSIWTTHDTVVTPPSSASLAGATDFAVQSICPSNPAQHGTLPTDPQVAAIVLAELEPGPPRRPSTCEAVSS